MVILKRFAVSAQEFASFVKLPVVSYNYASFAGSHILGWIKRICDQVAETADVPRLITCPMRLGSIPDYLQIVMLRKFRDAVDIAGVAEQMYWRDGCRPSRDSIGRILKIQSKGPAIDIAQYRPAICEMHHAGG